MGEPMTCGSSPTIGVSLEAMRSWSELPLELLELIAEQLGILELLSFLSVCKGWCLASTKASAQCESADSKWPWFLVYNNNSKCCLLNETCRKYIIDIPELDSATCIASQDGWLLLCQDSSMFFLCPFSRAKVDLPQLPELKLTNPIGVFTSAPTSPDCVVCVINHYDENTLVLHLLQRGANVWEEDKLGIPISEKITGAIFFNGVFYFFYSTEMAALTFDLKDKCWTPYTIKPPQDKGANLHKVPFLLTRKCIGEKKIKQILGLEEGDSISTCGTVVLRKPNFQLIHNEVIEIEEEKERRHKKGVWIHPRFFQLPPNQTWSL